ncbi:MAG: ankyrin repeat domain-containing protein [Verrucomicrobiota bacterium]
MRFLQFLLLASGLLVPGVHADTRILIIAGPKSHGPGMHEHPAVCALLAKHLQSSGLPLTVEVSQGWPQDAAKVAAADTLVIYGDGLVAHPAAGHLAELRQRYAAGKGLAIIHWALEPTDAEMATLLDDTIGGRFEVNWSVNPVWKMQQPILAKHPATRGVAPFEIEEEFYYHLRLRDDVTPLLQALPPVTSLGADGLRSGNPAVRQALADQIPQTLAWVVANPNQSRGFGFTGGHFYHHWANPEIRRLVLNAIVWTAGMEVPAGGVVGQVAATPVYQTIDEAIAKGDLADVRLQLELDPQAATKGGRDSSRPPLEQAILRNKTEIALCLLAAGADPNSSNASKRTPLHLAVERNNPALVTALLKAGAKPNARDQDGWTPLHHAAAKNQLATATALLAGGADPMTLSELGGTPLHEAAASGGAEIVHLLLDHKVDPSVKSKQGVTALDIARQYKNQAAIDVLEGL